MPRGGRRSGKPGQAYPNRTDLNKGPQPVGNFAGPQVPYGTGAELSRSQQAMPVAPPPAPGPAQGPGGPAMPPGPAPGSLGQFDGPTQRPNEPLTHGLPIGPGGGPEVMSNPASRPAMTLLQQLANQPYVSDEIRSLLSQLER